mgnify:CR=1 FL=1
MTFENYQYTRPNVEDVKVQLSNLIARLISANSTKETLEIFNEYNKLREHLETMSTLVEIRATIDTTDKFYEEEREFWDEFSPELSSLQSKFNKEMYNSKFKNELKEPKIAKKLNAVGTSKRFQSELVKKVIKANNAIIEHYKGIGNIAVKSQEHLKEFRAKQFKRGHIEAQKKLQAKNRLENKIDDLKQSSFKIQKQQ